MMTFTDVELIQTIRNDYVDCVHRGRLVVVDAAGGVIFSAGDSAAPGYLRSIGKPFQAASMIASGAAAQYQLTDEELALAAGSHSGTPYHTALVAGMLRKLDLTPDALRCGVIPPLNKSAYEDLLLTGQRPGPLHHNCSGKHTGMLATCRTHNYELETYTHADHPVQQQIRQFIAAAAELAPAAIDLSSDGCTVPTFGIPLLHVALMFCNLGLATRDAPASPLGRIGRIMQRLPYTYSGEMRLDAEFVRVTGGKLIVKDGAEGIVGVAVPERGVGVAIKVSDGSQRAIIPALLRVLHRLDILTTEEVAAMEKLYPPVIYNLRGEVAAQIHTVI